MTSLPPELENDIEALRKTGMSYAKAQETALDAWRGDKRAVLLLRIAKLMGAS